MSEIEKDNATVFILGIHPRSGTNFLRSLLLIHKDCVGILDEDYLIAYSNLLSNYVTAIDRNWRNKSSYDVDHLHKLKSAIRNCMLSLTLDIKKSPDLRLVLKSPTVRNLGNFYEYFGHSYLIILVRDGRAVTQSYMDSFGGRFSENISHWAEGAKEIEQFCNRYGLEGPRHLIVKYEDLITDLQSELKRILQKIHLDPQRLDFNQAASMPVIGSSTMRHEETGQVHWQPVAKPDGFDPLRRTAHWSSFRESRFNWLAGKEAEKLGYKINRERDRYPLFLVLNMFIDLYEFSRILSFKLNRLAKRIKGD